MRPDQPKSHYFHHEVLNCFYSNSVLGTSNLQWSFLSSVPNSIHALTSLSSHHLSSNGCRSPLLHEHLITKCSFRCSIMQNSKLLGLFKGYYSSKKRLYAVHGAPLVTVRFSITRETFYKITIRYSHLLKGMWSLSVYLSF